MERKADRELELKLAIPDGALDALLGHKLMQAPLARIQRRRRRVTTYFDTPAHDLARPGISLRVRCADGQHIQTLKADRHNGVAGDRAEWEWEIENATPDSALIAQTPIIEILPQHLDLSPVQQTDIERTIRTLTSDDTTSVEAALDEGAIIAENAREQVRELELELRAGEAAAVHQLAQHLLSAAPLTIVHESKAARGYRLRSGAQPEACKAPPIEIEYDMSAAEAFRRILNIELGHLLMNRPAAIAGDADGVHQMRLAIRRLRAGMTLFRPHLEPHATSPFEAALNPGLVAPIHKIVPALLDWLATKVHHRGGHIAQLSDSARHRLRKSLKKLRYACDFVASAYPPGRVEHYLHSCKKLQKRLGKFQDAVMATTLAEHLTQRSRPGLAAAIGVLAIGLERPRGEALRRLPRDWRHFHAARAFWR